MTIIIDTREQFKEKISAGLTEHGVSNRITKLDVGDYTTTLSSLGIERKTFSDFVGSSNRIFEQIINLKRTYNIPILLIEGSPVFNTHDGHLLNYAKPNFTKLNQTLKWYHASLFHVATNGILIFHTKNLNETIWFLKNCEEYFEKSVHHPLGTDLHNDKSRLISIYAMLPGIDAVLAKRLYEKFPALSNLAHATIYELEQVENIGEKKARAIVRFISGLPQEQK